MCADRWLVRVEVDSTETEPRIVFWLGRRASGEHATRNRWKWGQQMAAKVIIPAQLRQYTGEKSSVEATGTTVNEVLTDLDAQFPGIQERICEPDGRLRRFVNVFVNGEDVRALDGIDTPVKDGDEVGIIPAVAGGRA